VRSTGPRPASCSRPTRYLHRLDAWSNNYPNGSRYYSSAYARDGNGLCKVGVSHEIDTSAGDCPFNALVAHHDLDYTISVEGYIQATPCNMTPVETGTKTVSFHSRCALHRGNRCSGTLVGGGGPAAVNGTGYLHYHGQDPQGDPYDIWGSCNWVHSLIPLAGTAYDSARPGEVIEYGDISRESGGPWLPDHSRHQNGLEVDMRYPNQNGSAGPLNLADPAGLAAFDRNRLLDMVNALVTAFGRNSYFVESIILSDKVAPSFTQQELQRAVPITYDSSGVHDHHFHVILADEDGPDSSCY
jgi:hypothetical protein